VPPELRAAASLGFLAGATVSRLFGRAFARNQDEKTFAVFKRRAVMHGRFPHLSAFAKKFLEICGAGLASAVIALFIGQTDKPAAPLATVVYLSPADEQMIKIMRDDRAALLERLRSQPDVRTTPPAAAVSTPAAGAAVAATPPKSAQAASSRREPKPERAAAATAAKQRSDERQPVQPAVTGKPLQVITVASHPVASYAEASEPRNLPAPTVAAADSDWVTALKQIPGWFWPAGGGVSLEVPRPPLPVGNFLSRMM
jgi:hypothetical protein